MLTSSLWYLEKWHDHKFGWKYTKELTKYHKDSILIAPLSVGHGVGTGIVIPTMLAVSPYVGIQKSTMGLEDYLERKAYSGSQFSVKGGQIQFERSARKRMFLKGAAKFGSRFIPYVGWALFATDLYMAAKFLKSKI